PRTVYVAAMGSMWEEGPDRGVYKTTDGGKSWMKSLSVDERTGCSDLVIDPRNPDKLLAAMWEYRRWPWFFRSGGPGSGLHLTYDGGESWKRLDASNGLPGGELGRIGLAIAPSDPSVVYALIEATENALYRSDDGGESWQRVGAGDNVGNRPFYFGDIRVDPSDPDRVYSLWSMLSVSDDGGRSFRVLADWKVHPDHHALWIDPRDPDHLIDGNDGGIAISRDRGRTWRFVRNLPLAQFYHVNVDMDLPYHIYGGLQDNGSWRGPSAVWKDGGIRNHDWQELAFGDGFDAVADPRDSMRGFAMSQGGALVAWNLRTGEVRDVQPVAESDIELRFNWNAALAMDPKDPDTLYFGSQFVHRTEDGGRTWTVISPDLTTDDPEWQRQRESGGLTPDVTEAENYTTLVALAVSPIDTDVLWAGSDDGRLHVSRDRGATWTSVERHVPEVPRQSWIPRIEPSPHNSGTAFVVFDDHRRGNFATYAFRTDDYGRSWARLSNEGVRGHALVLVQDLIDPDLLFLGTELGLFVSWDAGASWLAFRHGVPTASVMDLVIHPREHDLVIATHGRGVFVVDDITALRNLRSTRSAGTLTVFEPRPAVQHWRGRPASSRFAADGEYQGTNRPYGARITYWNPPGESAAKGLAESSSPKMKVTVSDADGATVRRLEVAPASGLGRFVWDLSRDGWRRPSPSAPPADALPPPGPEVVP
ncbi:MAG: hypothetical protein KDC38_19415, partial [Planctomycetes bacterium]|nr:hypothetical protein [Planctomycetota bacterium]